MLRQADAFLAALPDYRDGRYQGRGVVLAGGGDRFFPSLYIAIRALRHHGCRLPIQVWYLGRNREMPAKKKAFLAPYGVECVDADKIRRRHPVRRLDGWELKVFATLHCPFEELLFLDADCYPCRNPEFLFELEDYRARGAIFWPDMVTIDPRLRWPAFGVPRLRRLGSVESGQFVINKRLSWQPLNLAWFYNDHSDYYYRYGYGDKHTFEVAWARCGRPFVMWESKSHFVGAAYLHKGPDELPLFVHRACDKFRFESHGYTTAQYHPLPAFYSALPLERQCWRWMSELAGLTGRKLDKRGPTVRIHRAGPAPAKSARFAIATLYTPEIADLGVETSKAMGAYARQQGYDAIVAKERIDASRPASWSKLLLAERYLEENPACAWLMWIDADAVITNPSQRLEDLVDENVDFLVPQGPPPREIDSGVFLVRNCRGALDMLRRAYAKVQYTHHPERERPALYEALCECGDTLRTRIISPRLLVSLGGEYQQGDFILHFAGCSPEAKLAGVKQALAIAGELSGQSSVAPLPGEAGDHAVSSSGACGTAPTEESLATCSRVKRVATGGAEFDVTPFLFSSDPWLREQSPENVRRCYDWKFRLARLLQPRRILEIGVRFGYSAAAFLAASPGAEYYGVDADNGTNGGTFGAHRAARAMLAREFPDSVIKITKLDTLKETPKGSGYDLVHVDADHSFEGCLNDLHLAARLGSRWVLVDDMQNAHVPGVARAVRDFLAQTGLPHLYFDDSFRGDCLIWLPAR